MTEALRVGNNFSAVKIFVDRPHSKLAERRGSLFDESVQIALSGFCDEYTHAPSKLPP